MFMPAQLAKSTFLRPAGRAMAARALPTEQEPGLHSHQEHRCVRTFKSRANSQFAESANLDSQALLRTVRLINPPLGSVIQLVAEACHPYSASLRLQLDCNLTSTFIGSCWPCAECLCSIQGRIALQASCSQYSASPPDPLRRVPVELISECSWRERLCKHPRQNLTQKQPTCTRAVTAVDAYVVFRAAISTVTYLAIHELAVRPLKTCPFIA